MRVRACDVPYMTTDWKDVIRKKRKYSKKYLRNSTDENLFMKDKWRNEATKLRRKAIKEYWKAKAEEINSKPKEFYKVFRPFLHSRKQCNRVNEINLNVNGSVVNDQKNVANHFAEHFSTVALDIGDAEVLERSEDKLIIHDSVNKILTNKRAPSGQQFNFHRLSGKK